MKRKTRYHRPYKLCYFTKHPPRLDVNPVPKPVIVWRSSGYVDLCAVGHLRPDADDLGAGLKRICRFAGAVHCDVATHSLAVAYLAERLLPGAYLAGLLHDAHEYYTGDLMTPLYHVAPELRRLGYHVQARIANGYAVPNSQAVRYAVRAADLQALAFERRIFGVDPLQMRTDLWPSTSIPKRTPKSVEKIYAAAGSVKNYFTEAVIAHTAEG